MLQVFGRVKSRTFRVVWLLEELDIPYELKEVSPRSEDAKKVYKNGKIPFGLREPVEDRDDTVGGDQEVSLEP